MLEDSSSKEADSTETPAGKITVPSPATGGNWVMVAAEGSLRSENLEGVGALGLFGRSTSLPTLPTAVRGVNCCVLGSAGRRSDYGAGLGRVGAWP